MIRWLWNWAMGYCQRCDGKGGWEGLFDSASFVECLLCQGTGDAQ